MTFRGSTTASRLDPVGALGGGQNMNAGTEKLLGGVTLLLLVAIAATLSTDDDDDSAEVWAPSPLVELDESNWQDMLEGEWLVKL